MTEEEWRATKKIGVGPAPYPHGVEVRGITHFSECYVAMFPKDSIDTDCTCWDDSPDWTLG